jgi:hypothetical protein
MRQLGENNHLCSQTIRHDFSGVSSHETVPMQLLAFHSLQQCDVEMLSYLKS